jgi:hypothetical protein
MTLPNPTFSQRTVIAFFLKDTKTGKREHIRVTNRHNGQLERSCRHNLPRGQRCETCVIEAMQLSCGHRQPADMLKPAGSCRKTAPCDRCGYTPRRQVERFLATRTQATFGTDLQRSIRRAVESPSRLAAFAEFVVVVLEEVSRAPRGAEEETRHERLFRAASVAGLLDVRHDAD